MVGTFGDLDLVLRGEDPFSLLGFFEEGNASAPVVEGLGVGFWVGTQVLVSFKGQQRLEHEFIWGHLLAGRGVESSQSFCDHFELFFISHCTRYQPLQKREMDLGNHIILAS